MSSWREFFEIKTNSYGKFLIVKHGEQFSYNFSYYSYKSEAASAASNIYRAMIRKMEKELLGV